MFCPGCGNEVYHTENIYGSVTYLYCLHCDAKTPIHPPEPVNSAEWDLVEGELFKEQVRKIERWEKDRPVLAALARNSR